MKCCVPFCDSTSRNRYVSFHPFPTHERRRDIWLKSLGISKESYSNTKDCRVCSKHFAKKDYMIGTNIKRVHKAAIPFLLQENAEDTNIFKKRKLNDGAFNTTPLCDIDNNGAGSSAGFNSKTGFLLKTTIKKHEEEIGALKLQVVALQKELEYVTLENQKLKATSAKSDVKTTFFTYQQLQDSNKKTLYYTGFETFLVMNSVYNFLLPSDSVHDLNINVYSTAKEGKKAIFAITPKDQFLLTMMRLRRGFNLQTLADLFHLSTASVGRIFLCWINVMYVRLGQLNIWPHRNILIQNAPERVQQEYKNVLGSIDCTEFFIETPSSLVQQSQCYSNYKGATTLKSLLMSDNNGAIIYVSPLFMGSMSDKKIIVESGFLDVIKMKLQEKQIFDADVILADKGFNISSLIEDVNININIPTFRITGMQFTPEQVETTRQIAHERVHVERAICRLKQYRILSRKIPIALLGSIEQIHTVCCILTIFRNRLRY